MSLLSKICSDKNLKVKKALYYSQRKRLHIMCESYLHKPSSKYNTIALYISTKNSTERTYRGYNP